MRLFKNTKINFIGMRKGGFMLSGLLVLASIGLLIMQGGPKYGIDFRGGSFLELRFEDINNVDAAVVAPLSEVRDQVVAMGYADAEIKVFGQPSDLAIQLDIGSGGTEEIQSVISNLDAAFPQYNVVERRIETVGPKIGGELVVTAINSILVSMLLILIYIMFRFELRFGVGAVLALLHDIIITLGIFAITQIEITIPVVAALLTIIGYSLNDTIVVFDRIRENLKRRYTSYTEVVNLSINETLSRTIVTSGTTFIVVAILYFFGSEALKDFALALICGVIVGTYSSMFVASPVLVEWEMRRASAKATPGKSVQSGSGKGARAAVGSKR